MEEFIMPLFVLLVIVPLAISVSAIKKGQQQQQQRQEQQERQQQQLQQQRQPAPSKGPALPPRDTRAARPTLTPTLHDHSGMFEGSLFADDGTEGSDPHDHGFDHEVDMPSSHSEEEINASLRESGARSAPAPGVRLDFSPKNIASAFVLQEVLKRK